MRTTPTPLLARLRTLLVGLLCLATVAALGKPGRAAQDAAKKYELYASYNAIDGARPKAAIVLRPTVRQELFFYVTHDGTGTEKLKVQLVAGDKVEAAVDVEAKAKEPTLVEWGPPGKEGPPQELPGNLTVVLRKGDKSEVLSRVFLPPVQPQEYITANTMQYSAPEAKDAPADKAGKAAAKAGGTLVVNVTAQNNFGVDGPPCKVAFDLRPSRIKGLVPLPRQPSISVARADQTEKLVADGLTFAGTSPKGPAYLTVDGYERAFVYFPNFSPAKGKGDAPVNSKPVLRAAVPAYSRAVAQTVAIEATNVTADEVIQVDLGGGEGGKEVFNPVTRFKGGRQVAVKFARSARAGGLVFQPEFKDWTLPLDLSGVPGKEAKVRLSVLREKGKAAEVIDGVTGRPDDDKGRPLTAVVQTIGLDDTAPKVAFVNPPGVAVRGKRLALVARAAEDESEVTKVVFSLGKHGADGKMPPGTRDVIGKRAEETKDRKDVANLWDGDFRIPADEKGPVLDVTVEATNAVGITERAVTRLKVVDPDPTKAVLAGKVFEKDVPVDHLPVKLLDDKGKVVETVRTADGGKFAFKGLEKGTYKVAAEREATSAAVEQTVKVKEYGEYKPELELLLVAGKGKKGRIAGTVLEGSRTQRGLTVSLVDAASNKTLDTTTTDDEGAFEFKDVSPGKYKVTTTKSASRTKAEKAVELKDKEQKTGLELKLYR